MSSCTMTNTHKNLKNKSKFFHSTERKKYVLTIIEIVIND